MRSDKEIKNRMDDIDDDIKSVKMNMNYESESILDKLNFEVEIIKLEQEWRTLSWVLYGSYSTIHPTYIKKLIEEYTEKAEEEKAKDNWEMYHRQKGVAVGLSMVLNNE